METGLIYDNYLDSLIEIIDCIENGADSQNVIAQEERNNISVFEKKYMKAVEEIKKAKQTVQDQYISVWESCTETEGLQRPRDQRPVATNLKWIEAVKLQEQAASRIREWFEDKTRRAILEREKKLQEDAIIKAKKALEEAEKKRRMEKEAAEAEKKRAERLIEEMKQRHKK